MAKGRPPQYLLSDGPRLAVYPQKTDRSVRHRKICFKNLCICHYFPSRQSGSALALLARRALLSPLLAECPQVTIHGFLIGLCLWQGVCMCILFLFAIFCLLFAYYLPVYQICFASVMCQHYVLAKNYPSPSDKDNDARNNPLPFLARGIYAFIIDKKQPLWSIASHG